MFVISCVGCCVVYGVGGDLSCYGAVNSVGNVVCIWRLCVILLFGFDGLVVSGGFGLGLFAWCFMLVRCCRG